MPDHAINPDRLPLDALRPRADDLHYSVRRYFVDEFFTRHAAALPKGSRVLDVGGSRARKRGQFNIDTLDLRVTVINIAPHTEPDILAHAHDVPLPDASADALILGEVVEHVPDPAAVLREAARLLRPGGLLLATAPFMFRVHNDPIDVGRYAPDWWTTALHHARFRDVIIERQGMLLSVMAELLRGWIEHMHETNTFFPGLERFGPHLLRNVRENLLTWEASPAYRDDPYYQSFTTGYGITARRA